VGLSPPKLPRGEGLQGGLVLNIPLLHRTSLGAVQRNERLQVGVGKSHPFQQPALASKSLLLCRPPCTLRARRNWIFVVGNITFQSAGPPFSVTHFRSIAIVRSNLKFSNSYCTAVSESDMPTRRWFQFRCQPFVSNCGMLRFTVNAVPVRDHDCWRRGKRGSQGPLDVKI